MGSSTGYADLGLKPGKHLGHGANVSNHGQGFTLAVDETLIEAVGKLSDILLLRYKASGPPWPIILVANPGSRSSAMSEHLAA